MRPVTILAVGLVASGTTAALVYRAVQNRVVVKTVATSANVPVAPVVVTAGEVPFGSKLEAAHVKVVEWPTSALPPNAFDKAETVVGRVALTRMVPNEPVTGDKIGPNGEHALLPLVIEPGMRGVTVRVNEVAAVGGFILPGSRVDVLVTAEAKAPAQNLSAQTALPANGERYSRTVLQNVQVLALGQLVDASAQTKPGESPQLTTATLLVTPDQGEMLALGAIEGQLQLVLRNFEDDKIVHSNGTAAHELFDVGARAALASAERVEFIRGAERLAVTF